MNSRFLLSTALAALFPGHSHCQERLSRSPAWSTYALLPPPVFESMQIWPYLHTAMLAVGMAWEHGYCISTPRIHSEILSSNCLCCMHTATCCGGHPGGMHSLNLRPSILPVVDCLQYAVSNQELKHESDLMRVRTQMNYCI